MPLATSMEMKMTNRNGPFRRNIARAALCAGVLAMGGAAAGDDAGAGWFTSDRVECEIKVTPGPSGTQLQGVVHARDTVSGRYELSVEQDGMSGHSMINQAGGFDAIPDTPARLGVVTIGGDGGGYTAKLKVHADGETFTCAKRVGGRV